MDGSGLQWEQVEEGAESESEDDDEELSDLDEDSTRLNLR